MRLILPTVIVVIFLGFIKQGLFLEKGYSVPLEMPQEVLGYSLSQALTKQQAVDYQLLIQQLRCVVCYNQNLSESQAPMAQDIKKMLLEKIASGTTKAEIIQLMIDRYGEFIVYNPPFRFGTALLWIGPLLLLGFTLFILQKQFHTDKRK
jgi:cytochrome c-type biogenesis protein CcmH/NrfF